MHNTCGLSIKMRKNKLETKLQVLKLLQLTVIRRKYQMLTVIRPYLQPIIQDCPSKKRGY